MRPLFDALSQRPCPVRDGFGQLQDRLMQQRIDHRLAENQAAIRFAAAFAKGRKVLQFQLPPIPGASQTFPVQPAGSKPVPHVAPSTAGVV